MEFVVNVAGIMAGLGVVILLLGLLSDEEGCLAVGGVMLVVGFLVWLALHQVAPGS